jgi:prophage maintenance system killer protein
MADALHYLTLQDMQWINFQVTGKVHPYRYDLLEEATFCQYGYGSSADLFGQAAKFLLGFRKLAPFDAGNDATAMVGFVAFLGLNGHACRLEDDALPAWLDKAARDGLKGDDLAAMLHEHGQHGHAPDVRDIIAGVLDRYPNTLRGLVEDAEPATPERFSP